MNKYGSFEDEFECGFFLLGYWLNPYRANDKEYFWTGPHETRTSAIEMGRLKQSRGQPSNFTNWVKGKNKVYQGLTNFMFAAAKVNINPNVSNLEWKE